jgi:hypothetical protein
VADTPDVEPPGVVAREVVHASRATTGTRGATYDIGVPTDYVTRTGDPHGNTEDDNADIRMESPAGTMSFSVLSYKWPSLPNGVLKPEALREMRKGWLSGLGRKEAKGHEAVLVAGVRAVGVDYTQHIASENVTYRCRLVFFGHGGALYTLRFCAPAASFAKQVVTMDRIAATMRFTGAANREPELTSQT